MSNCVNCNKEVLTLFRNLCEDCYIKMVVIPTKAKYFKENKLMKKGKNKDLPREEINKIRIEKVRACAKKYYLLNKDNPIYKENKRNYMKKYIKDRRKNDIVFRIAMNLRMSLNRRVSKIWCLKKVSIPVSLKLDLLKKRIESQFTPEMNWSNYNSYWEIDHIKPLSLFSSIEEMKLFGNSLENIQPVPISFNRSKRNKNVRFFYENN